MERTRVRESLLLGDKLDLNTASCELISPSLLQCDEGLESEGEWPFPELPSPPKQLSCARAAREAKQAAACEALAKAFEDFTPSHDSRQHETAPQEEVACAQKMDMSSPVIRKPPPLGSRRRERASFDPRRVSLAIAQNFDSALSEGGLLGEDDLLELTAEQPPQTAAALKAAALRASNSAFAGAGEGRICAHRPASLSVPAGVADEVELGPITAESPVATRPPRCGNPAAAPRPPGVMRDSMALFLQLEGAVTGENGFAADDVLRLNRSAKPLLASIAEDGAPAEAAGSEGTCTPLSGDAQGEAQAPRPPGGPAGMRDSMALFLQLEGAVEGKIAFEPDDVLRLNSGTASRPGHQSLVKPCPEAARGEGSGQASQPGSDCRARTELHPASGVPCSMPTKLRRPAGAVAGRPTLHMPAARPAPAAAPHHTHALGTAPLAPATVSSPLLTSSPSLAAAGHRRFPERRAFSAAGESAAAAARPDTGRLAAAARPGYGSAAYGSTGRPVTRRPTIAPPTEPSSSFALPPRRVAPAPVSNALGRTDGNAHSKTAAMQRPETSAAVGPLAAGRLRSSAEPRAAPAAVKPRVLQPKQPAQSRLPKAPTGLNRTPTPKKGSLEFQKMLEEAMRMGDAAAFGGKGGVKNSPLEGKPQASLQPRPTAEQRHFQDYRDS